MVKRADCARAKYQSLRHAIKDRRYDFTPQIFEKKMIAPRYSDKYSSLACVLRVIPYRSNYTQVVPKVISGLPTEVASHFNQPSGLIHALSGDYEKGIRAKGVCVLPAYPCVLPMAVGEAVSLGIVEASELKLTVSVSSGAAKWVLEPPSTALSTFCIISPQNNAEIFSVMLTRPLSYKEMFTTALELGSNGFFCMGCKTCWVSNPMSAEPSNLERMQFKVSEEDVGLDLLDYPIIRATRSEEMAPVESKLGLILVSRTIKEYIKRKLIHTLGTSSSAYVEEIGTCPLCGSEGLVYTPCLAAIPGWTVPAKWQKCLDEFDYTEYEKFIADRVKVDLSNQKV